MNNGRKDRSGAKGIHIMTIEEEVWGFKLHCHHQEYQECSYQNCISNAWELIVHHHSSHHAVCRGYRIREYRVIPQIVNSILGIKYLLGGHSGRHADLSTDRPAS